MVCMCRFVMGVYAQVFSSTYPLLKQDKAKTVLVGVWLHGGIEKTYVTKHKSEFTLINKCLDVFFL